MTTEKKFTDAAETFKENVNSTMKWLQDTTAAIIETQSKQIKTASEMYNKAITETFGGINKDNFTSSFGTSEKVVEIMQKNIENISNLSKTAMKTAMDFGKQAETAASAKETVKQIFDSYSKQMETITAANQKSFESITKQFDTTKTTFAPLAEKFKKELETNVIASKEKMEAIIDTYKKIVTPTLESNKELFSKLNTQMNTSVNTNLKFWSDLIAEYTAKTTETTKKTTDFLKTEAANFTKKTQTAKA